MHDYPAHAERRSDGSRWPMSPMSLTFPAAPSFAGYKPASYQPSSFRADGPASAVTPSTSGWQPSRPQVKATVEAR